MGRLLLIIAAVLIVFWILRSYSRGIQNRQQPRAGGGEDMVCCAHCGVHLPKSEGITSQGEFFCSDEHRRLHLQ